jgi:hypothetical protein
MSYTIEQGYDDHHRYVSRCWRCGYTVNHSINTCPQCSQTNSLQKLAQNSDGPIFREHAGPAGPAWSHETSEVMGQIVVWALFIWGIIQAVDWLINLF